MRRIRRGDAARSKMATDVQVSRILPFLDRLVLRSCIPQCILLCPYLFSQGAIGGFESLAYARDVSLRGRQFFLRRAQLLCCLPARSRASLTSANNFRALLRQPRAFAGERRGACIQVGWGRRLRLQGRKLFE